MFKLRPALQKDIKNIFDLSNDTFVRENSINKEPIKWENHAKWFNKRINNKAPFFIVEDENENFIGQVRFDNKNGEITVSISITERYRGKGYACDILKQAIKKAGLKKVTAYIYENNISSVKMFKKAGFRQSSLLKFEYNSQPPRNINWGGGILNLIFNFNTDILTFHFTKYKMGGFYV